MSLFKAFKKDKNYTVDSKSSQDTEKSILEGQIEQATRENSHNYSDMTIDEIIKSNRRIQGITHLPDYFKDTLVCPACAAFEVFKQKDVFICKNCGKTISIEEAKSIYYDGLTVERPVEVIEYNTLIADVESLLSTNPREEIPRQIDRLTVLTPVLIERAQEINDNTEKESVLLNILDGTLKIFSKISTIIVDNFSPIEDGDYNSFIENRRCFLNSSEKLIRSNYAMGDMIKEIHNVENTQLIDLIRQNTEFFWTAGISMTSALCDSFDLDNNIKEELEQLKEEYLYKLNHQE